jgi:hypothetical protein
MAGLSDRTTPTLDDDWQEWMARQGRGFISGAVNPFGFAGIGLRGFAYRDSARRGQEVLNRWHDEAPTASAVGSGVTAGGGLTGGSIGYMMARNAVRYPWHRSLPGAFWRDFGSLFPPTAATIAGGHRTYDALSGGRGRRELARQVQEYGQPGYLNY